MYLRLPHISISSATPQLRFFSSSPLQLFNAQMLPTKRRRLDAQFSDMTPVSPPPPSYTLNPEWQRHAPVYTPSDSTEHPAFASPLAGSWTDGFSHDPGFLASQEELRSMLFTIAQSAAPTRACSPVDAEQGPETEEATLRRERTAMRPSLSNSRRVEYLKNYVGQVAPWVSLLFSKEYPRLSGRAIK